MVRSRRILAVHRYYWPDTPPYASMLRAIVMRWVQDGHYVKVLSSLPSYKGGIQGAGVPQFEKVDGVEIKRLNLRYEKASAYRRIWNAIVFCLAIIREAVLRENYDLIMVSTSPPILAGLTCRIAAQLTGAKLVYHCMDIHPEIGRISGHFKRDIFYKPLLFMDRLTCKFAQVIVVLSEDMADSLVRSRDVQRDKIVVINNFSLPIFPAAGGQVSYPADLDVSEGVFRVLFAGNIGQFQGLDAVIDAMQYLPKEENIEVIFLGDGSAVNTLKSRARQQNVHQIRFVSHQPVEVARRAIAEADVGLISLEPGIYRYAYPSKTMTYLEEGCPLLVCVEAESELASFVRRERVGIAVDPRNLKDLADAIQELARSPVLCTEMSERARFVAAKEFSPDAVLPQWSRLVEQCFINSTAS